MTKMPSTFEEAVAYAKEMRTWSVFKHRNLATYQHIVDQGWLLHLMPYLVHNANSYTSAKKDHNKSMARLARKEAQTKT